MFVLCVAAVAWSYIDGLNDARQNDARQIESPAPQSGQTVHEREKRLPTNIAAPRYHEVMLICLGIAAIVLALDISIPQKSLTSLSGVFFGLVTGMVVAYGLGLIVDLLAETFAPESMEDTPTIGTLKMLIGVICCYFAVSFILQTKDDIRFVIPYVEFAKQTKGSKCMVLDTSVIIDGRIADICDTRVIDSTLIVPRFILHELQSIADSNDKLKRNRGRRGLDVLNKLQSNQTVEVHILDTQLTPAEASESVDQRLVTVGKKLNGRVVTNDYNLNKISQLRGVEVININDLATALRPVFLPGELMSVKVMKPGEEAGQGVGYLDDGTMVVIEGGREQIGAIISIVVTSVLQTSAGRMIFGKVEEQTGRSSSRPVQAKLTGA
jgi:uncharacterized protein YacL